MFPLTRASHSRYGFLTHSQLFLFGEAGPKSEAAQGRPALPRARQRGVWERLGFGLQARNTSEPHEPLSQNRLGGGGEVGVEGGWGIGGCWGGIRFVRDNFLAINSCELPPS